MKIKCPYCDGSGKDEVGKICHICDGHKEVETDRNVQSEAQVHEKDSKKKYR